MALFAVALGLGFGLGLVVTWLGGPGGAGNPVGCGGWLYVFVPFGINVT